MLLGSLLGAVLLLSAGNASAAEEYGAACADCHEQVVSAFADNTHSKTAYYGESGECTSCHSGALRHAESGEPSEVVNLAKVDAEKASETCLECHSKNKSQMFWQGSAHEAQDVSCTSCHSVHGGQEKLLAKADQKDVCFSCHFDVRADMLKRSRHPLREGAMSCSDCHNPHGARSEALIDAKSINDKCYECHTEKKAPVVWEHSPVKEDCMVCHSSHGSSNDKLLVTKVPRLCQECHMQGRHQSGTLGENSIFAFGRSCLNCHSQIHGSNSPSGAVLQR